MRQRPAGPPLVALRKNILRSIYWYRLIIDPQGVWRKTWTGLCNKSGAFPVLQRIERAKRDLDPLFGMLVDIEINYLHELLNGCSLPVPGMEQFGLPSPKEAFAGRIIWKAPFAGHRADRVCIAPSVPGNSIAATLRAKNSQNACSARVLSFSAFDGFVQRQRTIPLRGVIHNRQRVIATHQTLARLLLQWRQQPRRVDELVGHIF